MPPTPATAQSVLAIDGGAPVRTAPFPAWPQFSQDEVAACSAVLASGKVNYWTGDEGRKFEKEFAASLGRKYAVALANGSVTLELSLRALGVDSGEEVIVPSRSFIASASCVAVAGARPVFADCDCDSGNLTAELIAPRIAARTKAIIVVHLAGWPCEMDAIMELARERGLKVIEDCAQAQGAAYRGRPVGSFADAAIFSFCQDKIMTTGGEGGMLVTDNEKLFHAAWSYKDHGKDFAAAQQQESGRSFRWLHRGIGTNWRMTEMQAAMGRAMLPKISERVRARQRNAAILHAAFSQIPALRVPEPGPEISHAYYRFYAYMRPERLAEGWTRDRILAAIEAEGVPCLSGSCSEIYREEAFAGMRPRQYFANARELGETSLAFLVHPTLGEREMRDTTAAVAKVMKFAAT
jgi:dTDP-4-amino-4,6-dideoxygalactose transaminase